MNKHDLFKYCSAIGLALLCATHSWADYRLNNPIGPDGYYIVKWDCENDTWAESNDMEYDETFVFAVDLTGTKYESWVKSAQTRNGVTYPVENTIVSLNALRDDRGKEYKDNRARLWHIKGNIYGAMYNFAQFETKDNAWNNTTPAIGEQTKIHARMFASATLFSDRCYPIEPSQKAGSVWDFKDEWWCATDNQPLFVFAPYTGTKTGAQFRTEDMTPGTHIFYDNNHYVVGNGYAAPCDVNDALCCPFFHPLDPVTQTVPVGTDTTLVAKAKSGDMTGATYQWYRYQTSAGESTAVPYTGQGAQTSTCHPATNEGETDYTYYCFITTANCPDGVYTTQAQVIVYEPCPEYTITVDGVEVNSVQTFYPGGWYIIGCTSTAGNPTSVQLPTGVKAHMGHDTLYIHADATTAPLTIEFPTAETASYAACSGMLTGLISQCGEDQAYIFKWDDNKGYVVDNNGVVQMSTAVNDNTADRWLALPTGAQVAGKDVVYLYNLNTNRYLYHGPIQTANSGAGGDFSAALTSPTSSNSDEYKWIFYQGDQNRIYIMNMSNWTGNWQQAFVLHCRNWEYMYCEGNNGQYAIHVCHPDMKVGKLDGYDVSGEMHTSVNNLLVVTGTKAVLPATALGWNGTAPSATVVLMAGQDTTFTAKRTDTTHSINKTITYSSSDTNVATVDATTGQVTAVNSGTATITAKLEDAGCFDGAEITYQVQVKGCSAFTWSIDGEVGLSKLLYPGGWYMLSCTNDDGAPTITVTGTGVTTGAATTSGNTTTVKVTLNGNAAGTITLKASLQVSGMDCEDNQSVSVSECTETAAESRKIEWYNYNGSDPFPQYWIHGGASVYLRDNNGVLEADIEHNDGNDQWYIIKTGEKCQGEDVFYLQNVQTMRYVYRGSQIGNTGGDWEYTEALLSATNAQTDAYKWIIYNYNGKNAVVNVGGFTGTNFTNGAYMLHVRNWEAVGLFSNPNIPSPRMVCGKMANQYSSPAFYYKGYTTTVPITQFQTQIAWKDSVPDAVKQVKVGGIYTYAIERTDDLHSINNTISYESSDPTFATVDANGKVTIVGTEGTATIKAYLSDVGCFKGDTLSYQVVLNLDCPIYTWTGQTTPMYAGGWYEVSCTTTAGAPTITVTGSDVTATTTTAGNTTTVRVTLGGNANGTIKVRAENPVVGGYKLCPDSVMITVTDCPATPSADFKTTVNWSGATPPAEIVANTVGQTYTYTIVRTDNIHSINSVIRYESTDPSVATVDATTGKVTIVASSGECDIMAILEDVGCFQGDTLMYHVRLYDCTQDITTHTDYILPHQPKTTEDCSYIVLWDCANDTWAMDNTMEWGETFVLALNLAGTALGDWAMKPASDPALERSIAFDRFRVKNDEGTQFNLDASRLWYIRDTIFGAEFNFSQIPYTNGTFHTPAMGEQTEIAARLFGQETAKGAKCGAAGSSKACNWWQWSNEGSLQSEFTSEWLSGSYVSNNDQYLFRFAPYTGKSDPVIKPADDDPRDQWYDNHYFSSINGYRSPCPKDCPTDQKLTASSTTICLEKGETATIQLAGSESGWTYTLYQDGSEMSGSMQAGTGAALSWDELGVGDYTIYASATDATSQRSDWMGDCTNTQKITISAAVDCVPPEVCENVIYRKWNDLLFVDNGDQNYVAYQWYCDGVAMEGETRQFLYTNGVVLSGSVQIFYCVMTLADGTTVKACANTFDNFPASAATGKQQQAPEVIKYIYQGRLYIRYENKTYNGQGACVTGF